MAGDGPSAAGHDRVLGRATTVGQALPLGIDDPVIAARAVRRALGDAKRRAVDVETLVVATPAPLSLDAVMRFARRALGPHGASVQVSRIERDTGDAAELATLAAAVPVARDRGRRAIRLAIGIGPDGTTVALCLGPGR
jgi:hypothetical protein